MIIKSAPNSINIITRMGTVKLPHVYKPGEDTSRAKWLSNGLHLDVDEHNHENTTGHANRVTHTIPSEFMSTVNTPEDPVKLDKEDPLIDRHHFYNREGKNPVPAHEKIYSAVAKKLLEEHPHEDINDLLEGQEEGGIEKIAPKIDEIKNEDKSHHFLTKLFSKVYSDFNKEGYKHSPINFIKYAYNYKIDSPTLQKFFRNLLQHLANHKHTRNREREINVKENAFPYISGYPSKHEEGRDYE